MISKCSKQKHYSGKKYLNYRVAATVYQKYCGLKYVNDVFKDADVSTLKTGSKLKKKK